MSNSFVVTHSCHNEILIMKKFVENGKENTTKIKTELIKKFFLK